MVLQQRQQAGLVAAEQVCTGTMQIEATVWPWEAAGYFARVYRVFVRPGGLHCVV